MRTLTDCRVCRNDAGEMIYSVGNSAAVFRVITGGQAHALRCYFRPKPHLRAIYGDRLLKQELYLHTSPHEGQWVDVVLDRWIEGENLRTVIARAALEEDRPTLNDLSQRFDSLAADLTADNMAHGDLKPENILVGSDGRLHLIDFDAAFLPAFRGEASPELGTEAYQHPRRRAEDFDSTIDDYPAALISTALHLLRLRPGLYAPHHRRDGLMFSPRDMARDPMVDLAMEVFREHGLAAQYRLAGLLRHPFPALPRISELLRYAAAESARNTLPRIIVHPGDKVFPSENLPSDVPPREPLAPTADKEKTPPRLFYEGGYWGFRTRDARGVIPALYDSAFDFSEGLAAVCLGHDWHFIDTEGRVRISCPGFRAVKPFRSGRAIALCDDRRVEIDHSGKVFEN